MEEQQQNEVEALREALLIESRIKEMEAIDIADGYSGMKRIIAGRNRKRRVWMVLSRAAAILAIPLLISTLALGYIAFDKEYVGSVTRVEIKSAPGLVTRFELPDKSQVWLNSGSVLRYPSAFAGNKREVELEGEGYFEVESNPDNPFYVNTGSRIRIVAHGTRFNVNITEEAIETTLSEGIVKMLSADNPLFTLSPGEESVLDIKTNNISVNKVNVYEKTAWKDGMIIFRNAPLNDVFKRLSRRYNVDIVLHDEHQLAGKYSARVTFTDETIQQIFAYLEVAAPIKWKLSTPRQNNDTTLAKQRIDVWLIK